MLPLLKWYNLLITGIKLLLLLLVLVNLARYSTVFSYVKVLGIVSSSDGPFVPVQHKELVFDKTQS